ncbi:hypothetical protein ACMGD3_24220 [Lysinibacillus sphaericus]|uniref:hypothetical protein n=1 Tax=Lysinibacillus sphaericus TaxID=1421 RepID=UPI003F794A4D
MKLIKQTKQKKLYKRALLILFLSVFVILPPTAMFVDAEIISEEDAKKEHSGLFESILSKTILSFANSLIGLTGAQDVSILVYQEQEIINSHESFFTNATHANKESLVYGIFPEGIYKGIAIFYEEFNGAIPAPIVVLITLGGFLLLLDVFKGNTQRSQIKEWLLGLVMAILAMNFGSTLWGLVIGLNDILVSGTYELLKSNGIQVTSFISTVWDTGSTESIFDSKNLLVALIVFCACLTTFTLNYQYMLRMIMLGVLIIMFPIVVVLVVMPSKRSAIGQWLNLFASNVFLQTAHAITLGLFFFFLKFAEGFDFWLVLVMFFGLPTVTDLVQRFVNMALGEGFGGGLGTSAKNITGASSIMGLAALSKNMLGSKDSAYSSTSEGKRGVDQGLANYAISESSNKAPTASAPIGKGIGKENITEGSNNGSFDNIGKGEFSKDNKDSIGSIQTGEGSAFTSKSKESAINTNASPLQQKAEQYAHQMKQIEQEQKAIAVTQVKIPQNASILDQNHEAINTNEVPTSKENGRGLNGLNKIMPKVQSGMRNASKLTGTGIVRMSEAARNNRSFKMNAKKASIIAAAGAGYALSTMATGKGNTGLVAGAGVANLASKPLGSIAEKATRATQVGGEILQSKGQGQEPLAVTKERIGYKDSSQFADVKESQQMMQNLVGGRTAEVLGAATAKTVQYASSKNVNDIGGFNPQQATKVASKRERLEQQHIPSIQESISAQNEKINKSEIAHKESLAARTAYGNTPEITQQVKDSYSVLTQEKQQLKQFEVKESKMQERLNNFYSLESARKEALKLKKQKAL